MKKLFIPISFSLFVSIANADTWMGTYYPYGKPYNSETWINKYNFDSLEKCRAWAKSMIKSQEDEYECGRNCMEDYPGSYVCDETRI